MLNNENLELLKLWLIPGMDALKYHKIKKKFNNIKDVFYVNRKEIESIEGIAKQTVDSIISSRKEIESKLDEELNLIKKNNVKLITINDKNYPENLKNIYDPPPILYMKGKLENKDLLAIAIVGPRKATSYGLMIAKKFSREIAAHNITVISGLARGIDTASHTGALEGGRTLAVLGNGLNSIYPFENKKLSELIIKRGAVLSEFPMKTNPDRHNFPRRNRLVSGLSLGVFVIEATLKSGALITANCAIDQNRDVYAVPGNITSPKSVGSNSLLKDGAKFVTNVEDILEEFARHEQFLAKELQSIGKNKLINKELSEEEKIVYDIITEEKSIYIDEIKTTTNLNMKKLLGLLSLLELKGYIKKLPENCYCKKL